MIIFPSLLVAAAEKAGMKIPPDPYENYDRDEFPHFYVYCALQLGRAIRWGEHWDNAKVIAAIDSEKLKKMTLDDFIAAGLEYQ